MSPVDFTAVDSGYFWVEVNGTGVSQHTTEREALQRALNEIEADPSATVVVRREYRVDVVYVPPETSEPAPEPEPEPTPEPTPGLDPTPNPVFNLDWTQWPDAAAMLGDVTAPVWSDGRRYEGTEAADEGLLELVDVAAPMGTRGFRTNWPAIYNRASDAQLGVNVPLPPGLQTRELWLETYLQFDADWYSEGHKTFWIFLGSEGAPGARFEFRVGEYGGTRVQAKLNNGNVGVATDPETGVELHVTDGPGAMWDGQPHRVRLGMRSGAGGFMRVWLDDFPGPVVSNDFDAPSGWFGFLAIGRNGRPQVPSGFTWGQIRMWSSNPGW